MNCISCRKMNLPGGVRCSYCGVPFPRPAEFDLGMLSPAPDPSAASSAAVTGASAARGSKVTTGRRGLLGALAVLLIKAKSLLAALKIAKIAVTFTTMIGFIWVYQHLYGWRFSTGFALCILVHEMGHVVVNWRRGIKQSAPMFIPFFGALITLKHFPSPTIEAKSGAGGPVAGLLAALVCAAVGGITRDAFWYGLAATGFVINLFNLIPFWQLDGAHISRVFSPRNWNFVLLAMLLWVLKVPSPVLWLVLIVAFVSRLGQHTDQSYREAPPAVRLRMCAVFLGLCLSLGFGSAHYGELAYRYRTTAVAQMRDQRDGSRTATASAASQPPPHIRASADRAAALRQLGLTTANGRRLFLEFVYVLAGVGILLGVSGWFLAAYLLARAAGQPLGRRGAGFAGAMSGELILLVMLFGLRAALLLRGAKTAAEVALTTHVLGPGGTLLLLGAEMAALAVVIVFAIYHNVRVGETRLRMNRSWLHYRALAWAAAAAAVIAYWQNSPAVVIVLALTALVFYGSRRWLFVYGLASLWEQAGDEERALCLRRRAVELRPPPRDAAQIWSALSRDYLARGQGGPALEAIDAAAATGTAPDPGNLGGLALLEKRAEALVAQRRVGEALQFCEAILQAPDDDRVTLWRPVVVHNLLAKLALVRAWPDEALAQSDAILTGTLPDRPPSRIVATVLSALLSRARALTALGRAEEALDACTRALRLATRPVSEAQVSTTRAEALLAKGDVDGAEREITGALRRLPDSLSARFVRAQVLEARGQRAEARAAFQALASEYPGEYWGAAAAERLTSPPSHHAT